LDRSNALSGEGRFAEAARAAHDGLESGEDPGPLLVALSRAHLGRGQIDQAIETARDALFVSRSRSSVSHLIRVLTQTRRFGPEDGPMLRRAAARHPERAMLRHALGVFEALHGEPRAAREQLLAALQLEADGAGRRAIQRDLASTGEATARTA
jgi:thioredoxin-like negative regulator of GroEL